MAIRQKQSACVAGVGNVKFFAASLLGMAALERVSVVKILGYALSGVGSLVLFGASAVIALADESKPQAGQCRVVIDRSQDAGVFDVNRQRDDAGNCICYAYTGPETQDNATEAKVAALEESKKCPDAKVMAVSGPAAGAAAGGSSFLAGPLAPLLAAGALGGGAAAAAGGGGANETPVSP